jgi:hypothetical protein
MRRLVEAGPGGKIPVDTPAQRLYTRAKPAFFGLSYLRLWLADIRELTDGSRLYRSLLHVSRQAWRLASSPVFPEAPTPDPRLTPPRGEGQAPVHPCFMHLPNDGNIRVGEDRA